MQQQNLLQKIQNEIDRKQAALVSLQEELHELRRVLGVLHALPSTALSQLGLITRTLQRFLDVPAPANSGPIGVVEIPHSERNGANMPETKAPSIRGMDLAGKTVVDCAATILGERKGQSVHYRDLFREALARGYRGRASSSEDQLERSWIQLLRKSASAGGPVEKTGEGLFRLRANARADED